MNGWSLYDKAGESIPFSLNGYTGIVAVYYGLNTDPVKAGFDCLAGLNFDMEQCRCYPLMHACIKSYAGSGYRTFCGWIQVVSSRTMPVHARAKAQAKTFVSIDVAPALGRSDLPFAAYGNLPQLFDAPCHNLGKYAELQWTADTFLTTVPARSRDEEITRLLGFRWGYVETNIPDQEPVLRPLEVTGAHAWNEHLPYLRKKYGRWRFKTA
jgi:hypothetical protein